MLLGGERCSPELGSRLVNAVDDRHQLTRFSKTPVKEHTAIESIKGSSAAHESVKGSSAIKALVQHKRALKALMQAKRALKALALKRTPKVLN